jgi:hypothetical protein
MDRLIGALPVRPHQRHSGFSRFVSLAARLPVEISWMDPDGVGGRRRAGRHPYPGPPLAGSGLRNHGHRAVILFKHIFPSLKARAQTSSKLRVVARRGRALSSVIMAWRSGGC